MTLAAFFHSARKIVPGGLLLLLPAALVADDRPIIQRLPDPLVSWQFLGTPLWRVIGLALLALALAVLSRLVSRLALVCCEPLVKRTFPSVNRSLLEAFVGPFALLVSVLLFRAGLEWIAPSPKLHLFLTRALTLLLFGALFWLSTVAVDLSISHLRVRLREHHQTFYSVLPLASRIAKLLILALMIVAVLGAWGYNTNTILAGLGVGGIAIALAAQKTLENLFGGVSIITDRPVSVGDFCKFGDKEGTVEDIGLRSTRVRAPDRTLVTIPNGQFSSMTIENISARDKMFFHFKLNLRRDTTPSQLRALLASISQILKENSKLEPGTFSVRFVGLEKDSLDLETSAYVLTQNGDEFAQTQQELYLEILDAVSDAGASVAMPAQANLSQHNGDQPLQPANGRR